MRLRKGDDLGKLMDKIAHSIDNASKGYAVYRVTKCNDYWLQCYSSLVLAVQLLDKTKPDDVSDHFDTDTSWYAE